MDDKIWMIVIGVGGYSLSQIFNMIKDKNKNHEEKLNMSHLILMEHKTEIAVIKRELEGLTKVRKDIDAAHEGLRSLNKELVEVYETNEKLKKELHKLESEHSIAKCHLASK